MNTLGKMAFIVMLLLGLGLLIAGGDSAPAGEKKPPPIKKGDPQKQIDKALRDLSEAKRFLAAAASKELTERTLEPKAIAQLERAIKAVDTAIAHAEKAKQLDKK